MLISLVLVCLLVISGPALADDIQERFDSAVEAIEQDRLRSARRTLKELLAENPTLQRARLELARAHYLSYDFAEAERLAQQVLDDPETPPSVQTTVLAFLAQIKKDRETMMQRHIWTPSIYAGLLYDSNLNFGPSRDIVDIGGLLVNVAPNSQEKEDFGWVLNPGISYIYNPGKTFQAGENTGFFAWQSQADVYYRGYFDENDFNFGVLTLRTGPTWFVPREWRASIGLQGDQLWLDDNTLAFITTLNPDFIWELSPRTSLEFDAQISYRSYWRDRDSGREGWYGRLGADIRHTLANERVTFEGGVGYADFSADDDIYGFNGPDAFVGVIVNAWTNGTIYGRITYRLLDFDATEPGFTGSRDDDEFRYTAGFQHDFKSGFLRRWSLLGNWTYTDNESKNVSIRDYSRHEANLGLSRAF